VLLRADELLSEVEWLLETAEPRHTNARHLIPLLIASGRRLSEIANGRSKFAPGPTPYSCLFQGQLKRKDDGKSTYIIPLLVPYITFARAFAAFRTKQLGESNDRRRAKAAVATLTNQQVKDRYASPLSRDMAKNCVLPLPPPALGTKWINVGPKPARAHEVVNDTLSAALGGRLKFTQDEMAAFAVEGLTKGCIVQGGDGCYFKEASGLSPHDLRALYGAYVGTMFTCNVSFNRLLMRVLGHQSLDESLSYNHWKLHDSDGLRGVLGPLPSEHQ